MLRKIRKWWHKRKIDNMMNYLDKRIKSLEIELQRHRERQEESCKYQSPHRPTPPGETVAQSPSADRGAWLSVALKKSR